MSTSTEYIGAFKAKTKLSSLLEQVVRGASFVITKHDRPVARLVAFEEDRMAKRTDAVAAIRAMRKCYHLKGVSVRRLREEGRA